MPNFDDINKSLETNFLSKEKFAVDIEEIVKNSNLNYIDAIVEYCEKNGVEIEVLLNWYPNPQRVRYDATVN